MVIETTIERVSNSWNIRGSGFIMDGGAHSSHLAWSCFYSDVYGGAIPNGAIRKTDDTTYRSKRSRKPASLECSAVSLDHTDDAILCVFRVGTPRSLTLVGEWLGLGSLLDGKGSNSCSLEHRLAKAYASFSPNSQILRGLLGWSATVSADLGAGSWHASKSKLLKVRT